MMNKQSDAVIREVLDACRDIPFLQPDELPSIDLYMDQVTTLIEEKLSPTRRSQEDKLLTKAMINNYSKNHLLPPPEKKRYSREHILILTLIYFFKSTLSMQDIKQLLDSVSFTEETYRAAFRDVGAVLDVAEKDAARYLELSGEKYGDTENQEKERLRLFSLITDLIMDIYIKKRMIEQLIDEGCP